MLLQKTNIIFSKKQTCNIFVGLFLLPFLSFSQINDSSKTEKYKAIIGFKLHTNTSMPNVFTSSILGIEYKLFPNRNLYLSYRNFFNAQFIAKRESQPYFQKNTRYLLSKNCFDISYKVNFNKKSNFIKIGAGVYFERNQQISDQYIFLSSPHFQGIELSIYTKFKWLNVGLRQQIQLFENFKSTNIAALERRFINICFEIPINIK